MMRAVFSSAQVGKTPTVSQTQYAEPTLTRLTWRNLGYRFGQSEDPQPSDTLDAVYRILAQAYDPVGAALKRGITSCRLTGIVPLADFVSNSQLARPADQATGLRDRLAGAWPTCASRVSAIPQLFVSLPSIFEHTLVTASGTH